MAMEKIIVEAGTIGKTISLELDDTDGTPINLTDATVTLYMYAIGSDDEKWNHACVVDEAASGTAHYASASGDLDDAGVYYTKVKIAYVGGNIAWANGPAIEIFSGNENVVTISEFLSFIDIKEENSKSPSSIRAYLEHAENLFNADIAAFQNTTSAPSISHKKTAVIIRAAILYFMNMDESYGNPNLRKEKIAMWKEEYASLMNKIGAILSTDAEDGNATARRVKHSDYSNPNSYLYEG